MNKIENNSFLPWKQRSNKIFQHSTEASVWLAGLVDLIDGDRKPVASRTWKFSGHGVVKNYITIYNRRKVTSMKVQFTAIYFRDNL